MTGARFHPKYSGSNAHRFMNCPGQVRLAASLPDIETEHAKEGTFAHLVLEAAVKNGIEDAGLMAGVLSINGRWVDEEITDAIQCVLDYVNTILREYPSVSILSEYEVVSMERGGTIDVLLIDNVSKSVWVIDYKHGAGLRVEADDNYQGRTYLWEVAKARADYALTFTIIQPRHWAYNGAREVKFLWPDLFDFAQDAEAAIEAAEKPDAPLIAGTWCTNCKAAAVCPALDQRGRELTAGGIEAAMLDPDRLAWIVLHADEARAWLRACEQYVRANIMRGQHFPGLKPVLDKGRRRYRPDMAPDIIARQVVSLTAGRLKPEDIMPPRLKPLTEVEKLVVSVCREAAPGARDKAAETAKKAFAFLTLRDTSGAISLVPETDPRPAYVMGAGDFEGVTIEHNP